jgi:hypothetical protein
MEVRSTTDAMPTAMPSAVRKLRILCLDMAPMASFVESLMSMMVILKKFEVN